MLDLIENSVSEKKMSPEEKTSLKLNIGRIPEILLDNTDRNRTSPFAFTGNRFEFRAVGSSANCASAMIALNTAVAEQLVEFKNEVDELIEKGLKKDEAIFQVLKKLIGLSKVIRFDGNGYCDEWKQEAARRGLTNVTSVPEALEAYYLPSTIDMFSKLGVLSEREIESRAEVEYEKFTKKIQIEARVLGDLAINHIVPTAVKYQTTLIDNVKGLKEIFGDEYKKLAGTRVELINEISGHISAIEEKVFNMVEARKKANVIENGKDKAYAYDRDVRPYLEDIRDHIDKLELIVEDELWPLPKYRELLFNR
ncbi:MAG TPA: glutamine synthetase type III, partial [Prolixibacteraceae bacterium]|nr:glutamine synthetase type III [Prolixibacteraceae bacterium]